MDVVTVWRDLTHSHGWLLPETYQLLKDMGNDFADALEGTASEGAVFRVTSVTRTDKQQRKLRRRNLNATNSRSTHSYGASFDIAFVDRSDDKASCGTPTREMERLLNRYQKAGIIYVIPEGAWQGLAPGPWPVPWEYAHHPAQALKPRMNFLPGFISSGPNANGRHAARRPDFDGVAEVGHVIKDPEVDRIG